MSEPSFPVLLTWQPDNFVGQEELTALLSGTQLSTLKSAISAARESMSDAVAWIPVRAVDGSVQKRLFRLHRIESLEKIRQ